MAMQHVAVQRQQFEQSRSRDMEAAGIAPDVLALASLCHVLLNSNEFLYVD
jgi:hypothetical protein